MIKNIFLNLIFFFELNLRSKFHFYLLFLLILITAFFEIIFIAILSVVILNFFSNEELITSSGIINDYISLAIKTESIHLIFLIFIFLRLFLNLITNYFKYEQVSLTFYTFQKKFFNKFINLKYSDAIFFKSHEVSKNINFDAEKIFFNYVISAINLFSEILILIFLTLSAAYFMGYQTFFAIMSLIFVTLFFNKLFKSVLNKLGKKFSSTVERLFNIIKELFGFLKEININNFQAKTKSLFSHYILILSSTLCKINFINSSLRFFYEFVIFILILIFFLLSKDNFNQLNFELSFLGILLIRLYPNFSKIQSLISACISLNSFAEELKKNFQDITHAKQENVIKDLENIKYEENFEIILKNVFFQYKDKKILNNLNFKIKKNDKILIYGETGSGKSTLIDIITGLIQPFAGKVLLNNKLLMHYKITDNFFGLVGQKQFFIDNDLVKNITFFSNKNKTVDEIEDIINFCELKEFVNKDIGENASKLSGGQRQKLAIARVLINDPQILILDEPTSAMDKKLADRFIQKLLNLKNKTILIISHEKEMRKKFNKKIKVSDFTAILETN